jgi:6-phosphogluconate dehydrogenase (decarboxylating)
MELGMIGLGRMRADRVQRLLRAGVLYGVSHAEKKAAAKGGGL